MLELASKTTSILKDFMDRADEFVNAKDTLRALVGSRQEGKRSERRGVQTDIRAKTSWQGMRLERWPNHNLILIHNNLGVGRDEGDNKKWRHPQVEVSIALSIGRRRTKLWTMQP